MTNSRIVIFSSVFVIFLVFSNIHLYSSNLNIKREQQFAKYETVKLHALLRRLNATVNLYPPEVSNGEKPQEEYFHMPEIFKTSPPVPTVFSLNTFNFPADVVAQNEDVCDCKEGKEDLLAEKGVAVKEINFVDVFGRNGNISYSRKERHESHRKRYWSRDSIIFNNPDIPLKYAASGLVCQPHHTIHLPIVVTEFYKELSLRITSQFGSFSISNDFSRIVTFQGDSRYLNSALLKLRYKNLMYDAIAYNDLVTVWLEGFPLVSFEIKIKRIQLEVLSAQDTSQAVGEINSKVTVIVKTFQRYACLMQLYNSIRHFYPEISIIIADDSADSIGKASEELITIKKDKRVTYLKLPENTGWNSGRALLISQVQTEFFVYCDDDFEFNKYSSLGAFLDIITKTGFDLIGGGVGMDTLNMWRHHGKYRIENGNDGFCVNRENGFHGRLEGFKNCQVADVVANFFIARTLAAGTVRFDPLFKKIAHREFFLDSIGVLRIAVCPHVYVAHSADKCEGRTSEYMSIRKPTGRELSNLRKDIDQLWYQRNYLKCVVDVK